MKVLSTQEHQELKQKADNYDKIVASVLALNNNLKAEDITLESIASLINNASGDDNLQEELNMANETIAEMEKTIGENDEKIRTLEEEVEELKGTAAEGSKEISKEKELNAQGEGIVSFADKNKGNTEAILEEARKGGLI